MEEVLGDAAICFDSLDTCALANSIVELWHDEENRRQLGVRGLERNKMFSWDKTAKEAIAF